jgi:AcrR family transcriptional regulator
MKQLTERQKSRRAAILAAARELIVEHGYEGVTMRELAARSDVALKTLYQQYDNKENLLAKAVEEMHANTYADIMKVDKETGLDKLFFIIDTVLATNMENDAYARTMAPILARGASTITFIQTRKAAYRQALDQMQAEGDVTADFNTELMLDILHRQSSGLYFEWARGLAPTPIVGDTIKLQMCMVLSPVTTGKTHDRVAACIHELTKKCADFAT